VVEQENEDNKPRNFDDQKCWRIGQGSEAASQ